MTDTQITESCADRIGQLDAPETNSQVSTQSCKALVPPCITLADAQQKENAAWIAMEAAEKRLHQSDLWKEFHNKHLEWYAAHELVEGLRALEKIPKPD
jgi:hypothetical protein